MLLLLLIYQLLCSPLCLYWFTYFSHYARFGPPPGRFIQNYFIWTLTKSKTLFIFMYFNGETIKIHSLFIFISHLKLLFICSSGPLPTTYIPRKKRDRREREEFKLDWLIPFVNSTFTRIDDVNQRARINFKARPRRHYKKKFKSKTSLYHVRSYRSISKSHKYLSPSIMHAGIYIRVSVD